MKGDSPYIAASKLALAGVSVTPQSIYNWLSGAEIKETHLEAFCSLYGISPVWIRYGIDPQEQIKQADQCLIELITDLTDDIKEEVLDYLDFKIHRSKRKVIREKIDYYNKLLHKLRSTSRTEEQIKDHS